MRPTLHRPARAVAALCVTIASFGWPGARAQELCGTWATVDAPEPGEGRYYSDLAVVAPDDIWAVGAYNEPNAFEDTPLAIHWDGSTWTEVPVPCPAHPLDVDCALAGVSAISSDEVWAVGSFTHPAEFDKEPFTLRWNGSVWDWIPTLTQPDGEGAIFFDVEAIAGDDVWAVGRWPGAPAGGITEPLAAHWDGSSWTSFFVPYNTTAGENFENTSLHALSVVSSDDIWAVGSHASVILPHVPYIARWDGSSWEVFEPRPEPIYTTLHDIAALAADDVWVSASKYNEDNLFDPFQVFLHWDGSGWTEVPDPNRQDYGGSDFAHLPSGLIWSSATAELSLWDGQAWERVADSPDPTLQVPLVLDMEAVSECDVWAVGQRVGGSLVLHLEPGAVPAVAPLGAFRVSRGLLLSGDLTSLTASDDDRLEVDADLLGASYVTETAVVAESPSVEVTRLDLRLELSASQAGPRATVLLRNFDTGQWNAFAPFVLTEADAVHEVLAIENPDAYIRDGDGRIVVSVRVNASSAALPTGFVTRIDEILVSVTP